MAPTYRTIRVIKTTSSALAEVTEAYEKVSSHGSRHIAVDALLRAMQTLADVLTHECDALRRGTSSEDSI